MKMSQELRQLAKDVIKFAKRNSDNNITDMTPDQIARVIAVLAEYRNEHSNRLA